MSATCEASWGCCPKHGAELRGTGGWCWCKIPGCDVAPDLLPTGLAGLPPWQLPLRGWHADRMGEPCTEPAQYLATDPTGAEMRICEGHRVTLLEEAVGAWSIRPINRSGAT